jgi:hypothetical protein
MGYTPFARWRNFTLKTLKTMLEVFPDLSNEVRRNDAIEAIETKLTGYKQTAYQFCCQLGLESRLENFTVQNYLYAFDDENLKKYMKD